ncbi:hypothetical protein PI126_g16592 [Phytophthora idaei]|nr:hypothetical protein PI126_g16592 [Phytophthora idaei]
MRSRDNKRKGQGRRAESHRDGRRDDRQTRKEESRDHRVTINSGEEDFDRRPPSSYESEREWSDDDQSSGDDSENDSDYMVAGFGSGKSKNAGRRENSARDCSDSSRDRNNSASRPPRPHGRRDQPTRRDGSRDRPPYGPCAACGGAGNSAHYSRRRCKFCK